MATLDRVPTERERAQIAERLPSDIWRRFGTALDLKRTTMDQIDCKATGRGEDIVERYCQLFQIWIEEDENPTCQKLIEALRSLKKCGLAKMVKKIVTNKEDRDPNHSPTRNMDKYEPILSLHKFTVYKLIGNFLSYPVLGIVTKVALALILVCNFLLSIFLKYSSGKMHSALQCTNKNIIILLYILTYVAVPSILIWIVARNTSKRFLRRRWKFSQNAEDEKNADFMKKVIELFWDSDIADDSNGKSHKERLKELIKDINKELNVMFVTSILQAILMLIVDYMQLTNQGPVDHEMRDHELHLSRIIISFLLNCSTGVLFSVFLIEIKIRHLIAAILKLPYPSSTNEETDEKKRISVNQLKSQAKVILDCLLQGWCILELAIYLGVQVYTIILFMSVSAGQPLSCGSSNVTISNQENLNFWLLFIVSFTVIHLLSTTPYLVCTLRITSSIVGSVGIFLLSRYNGFADLLDFNRILDAIVPCCFLFWYLFAMIRHEYIIIVCTDGRDSKHWKRLARRLGLLVLLSVATCLAVWQEYQALNALKEPKDLNK